MLSIQRVLILLCICTSFVLSASKDMMVQFKVSHHDMGLVDGYYYVDVGLFPKESFDNGLILAKNILVTFNAGVMVKRFPISNPKDLGFDTLYLGLKMRTWNESVFIPVMSAPKSIFTQYTKIATTLYDIHDWLKISTENHRLGIGTLEPKYVLDVSGNVGVRGDIYLPRHTVTAHSLIGSGRSLTSLVVDGFDDIYNKHFHFLSPKEVVDDFVIFVDDNANVGIGVTNNIKDKVQIVGTLNVNGNYVGTGNFVIKDGDQSYQMLWQPSNSFFGVGRNNNDSNLTWGKNEGAIVLGDYQQVSANYATILGGKEHSIDTGSLYATIVGGQGNKIESNAMYSGIFSGKSSTISAGANDSVIIGGGNGASIGASHAIILGGVDNSIGVNAAYSVAMGHGSKVNHEGVFMFSDSRDIQHNSVSPNQFLIFAENGVGIGTNNIFNTTKNTDKDGNKISISSNSLHVAGDVVVSGTLYGDATYLTVSNAWIEKPITDPPYVYYPNKARVGPTTSSDFDMSLVVQGSTLINGQIKASPNARSKHVLGLSSFGSDSGEMMRLSHVNASGNAIEQSSSGATTLNALENQFLTLGIDNVAKMSLDDQSVSVNVGLSVSNSVTASGPGVYFSGDGAALRNLRPSSLYHLNKTQQVVDTLGGFLDVITGGMTISRNLIIKDDSTALLRMQQDSSTFNVKLKSSSQFNIELDGYDSGSEAEVFKILNSDTTTDFLTINKNGRLTVGDFVQEVSNNENDRLRVSGNAYFSKKLTVNKDVRVSGDILVDQTMTAGKFVGSGVSLNNVKLEGSTITNTLRLATLSVTKNVTVDKGVTITDVLALSKTEDAFLSKDFCEVGKIFATNDNIYVCKDQGSAFCSVSLLDGGSDGARNMGDVTVSGKAGIPIDVILFGSDVGDDILTYIVVNAPSGGSVDVDSTKVTYTSGETFDGMDTFTYKPNDGTDYSCAGTVTITVLPNNPPMVHD
jgi:hypothetical protein